MQIIEGSALSNLVDYSFGDHMGGFGQPALPGGFIKYANAHNQEFLDKAKQFEGKIMTLYIDNIRLYPRETFPEDKDKQYVNYLMMTNNLLGLCSLLPSNGFIIFTGQEDTPINGDIRLPFNVEKIYGVNALFYTDRIIPIPFGLQRKMNEEDNRLEVLKDNVENETKYQFEPLKLLYINCGIGRNIDRLPLTIFEDKEWATTRFDKDSKFFPYDKYQVFLDEIKNHKFMVCPWGHGMDCHRNWESLYMRRVPIMKDHPYFRKLMEGFPVLFVKQWEDITEELLKDNDHLYQEAQQMDMSKLDLDLLFKNATKI